jgi:hypothetical protein
MTLKHPWLGRRGHTGRGLVRATERTICTSMLKVLRGAGLEAVGRVTLEATVGMACYARIQEARGRSS